MLVHPYYSSSGRDLVFEYIDSLPAIERADGFSVLELMRDGRLDELYTKPWEKKVYEVYFLKHNRIFYVAADGDNLYLLHACRKQKNKTERKDAALVRKRAKELGASLGKKFI